MIRDGRVLGVQAQRRRIEQVESFRGHARDDFRGDAAPRERLADREQPPVRATLARTVSVSSGFTLRRSMTSISQPSAASSAAQASASCTIAL